MTIHDLTLDTLKIHESHDSVNKQILRIYIMVQCWTSKVDNFANSPGGFFWHKLSSDSDSGKQKESKNALYGSSHGKMGVANFLGEKNNM